MGYSKLTYDDFQDNIDYWVGTKGLLLPRWADEIAGYGDSVSAIDFYEDVFKSGDLEPSRVPEDYQTGEYGAIALELVDAKFPGEKKERQVGHRTTVTDGVGELIDLIDRSDNFCLISPISYAGKRRTNENARFLHALCVEVDNIEPRGGLEELFFCFKRDSRPVPHPTYIVCSGTGLHLYWVFERPIPLFKNIFMQLSEIKKYLTWVLWQKPISRSWQHIQYEPVGQAFRMVGTLGKNKKSVALAFKVGENLTIEAFNERLPKENQLSVIYKSNLTRAQAKERYPDWYRRRVEEKQPRGHYNRAPGIYYSWIEKVKSGAEEGHRYHCLENLCALAVQCCIPPEQVESDCRELAVLLEERTTREDNHFGEYDIMCALRTYEEADDSAYHRKIEYIALKTQIPLVPNRRNGRKQKDHIRRITLLRDADYPVGTWREGNGRKSKEAIVKAWRKECPNGSKADCIRDTGLSKPTVYKWWDSIEKEEE